MKNTEAAPIIEGDWMHRDNFPTYEQAHAYATFLSKKFPMTPYRIRRQESTVVDTFGPKAASDSDANEFVVEFILV
jgi:hypothetical protein